MNYCICIIKCSFVINADGLSIKKRNEQRWLVSKQVKQSDHISVPLSEQFCIIELISLYIDRVFWWEWVAETWHANNFKLSRTCFSWIICILQAISHFALPRHKKQTLCESEAVDYFNKMFSRNLFLTLEIWDRQLVQIIVQNLFPWVFSNKHSTSLT